METKEKILALFTTNDDGYITGFQQEFYDGTQWQVPFDTANAIEIAPAELDGLQLGASKLVDGHIMVDTDKLSQIAANVEADTDATPEQKAIAQLTLLVAQLNNKVKELGGGSVD